MASKDHFPLKGNSRASWQRMQWHSTPILLPGKSHGQRSLVGCSPWGLTESDTTKQLHFHFSLSCIGEGNGNPLQCSCLENPRDGRAWWAAVYGVAQSQTWLKQLSSSSSSSRASWRNGWFHIWDWKSIYEISLDYLFVPKSKEALHEWWGYVKRMQEDSLLQKQESLKFQNK